MNRYWMGLLSISFFNACLETAPEMVNPETELALLLRTATAPDVHELTAKVYEKEFDFYRIDTLANADFQDAKLTVNMEEGTVTIQFNYSSHGFWRHLAMKNVHGGMKGFFPKKFLFRFFDKNGQYITHFETKEFFYPPDMPDEYWPGIEPLLKKDLTFIKLEHVGNVFTYTLSQKDLAYIKQGEFGWDMGNRFVGYHRKDETYRFWKGN